MNRPLWVVALCAAAGAAIGVVIAERIAPGYWTKEIIIGVSAAIGSLIGALLARK